MAAADVPSEGYQWITVGEFVPVEGDFVYIAPVDNGDVVQAVFTDRIELQPVQ